jgi:hypothetical protein
MSYPNFKAMSAALGYDNYALEKVAMDSNVPYCEFPSFDVIFPSVYRFLTLTNDSSSPAHYEVSCTGPSKPASSQRPSLQQSLFFDAGSSARVPSVKVSASVGSGKSSKKVDEKAGKKGEAGKKGKKAADGKKKQSAREDNGMKGMEIDSDIGVCCSACPLSSFKGPQ